MSLTPTLFGEKAEAKGSDRYADLAKTMEVEAERVTAIWASISKDRRITKQHLEALVETKELYVDIKAAQGIQKAVAELENVEDDLVKLSTAMTSVQKAVLGIADSGKRKE